MASFHFELVSPDKLLFNGQAEDVLVPDIGEAQGKHTRLFVRGGFADVSKAGLILLAETAIPVDELSADRLGLEIKDAEEDLADAPEDQKRLAQEKLDRLRELKDALKI